MRWGVSCGETPGSGPSELVANRLQYLGFERVESAAGPQTPTQVAAFLAAFREACQRSQVTAPTQPLCVVYAASAALGASLESALATHGSPAATLVIVDGALPAPQSFAG